MDGLLLDAMSGNKKKPKDTEEEKALPENDVRLEKPRVTTARVGKRLYRVLELTGKETMQEAFDICDAFVEEGKRLREELRAGERSKKTWGG